MTNLCDISHIATFPNNLSGKRAATGILLYFMFKMYDAQILMGQQCILLYLFIMKNTIDEVPDKGQIEREHMDRIGIQDAAEQENLKYVKTIKGADLTVYKDRKYKKKRFRPPKKEVPDRVKLVIMRRFQFLTWLIGLAGIGVIFLNINDSELFISISEDFVIEINLILLGCAMAVAGVVGMIGFQHRHDKISDRVKASGDSGESLPKSTSTREYW